MILLLIMLEVVLVVMMIMVAGKREIKELQKTAILGTAHILRKVQI